MPNLGSPKPRFRNTRLRTLTFIYTAGAPPSTGGVYTNSSPNTLLKKREGVPEMGTKPLKGLRGHRASNRGSAKGL